MEGFGQTIFLQKNGLLSLYLAFAKKKTTKPKVIEPEEPQTNEEPLVENDDDTIDLNDASDEIASPLADDSPGDPEKKPKKKKKTKKSEQPVEEPDSVVEESEPEPGNNKPFHYTTHDRVLFIVVIVLLALFGAAAAVAYIKPLHKTQLAGISTQDPVALTRELEKSADNYQLTIQYPNGTKTSLPLQTLGIEVNVNASVAAAAKAQKPDNVLSRLRWWHTENVPLVIHVDDAMLDKAINKYATLPSKPAKNATLSIKNGTVKIVGEKTGQTTTVANAEETIKTKVKLLNRGAVVLSKQEVKPAITTSDIEESKQKVEKILGTKVSFTIGTAVYKPTKQSIGAWIEVSPKEEFKTIDVDVNSGRVLKYIDKVAAPHIQPAKNQVVLKQSDGTTRVLVAGRSGTDVVKKDDMAAEVAASVVNGENISVKAAINYAKYETVNAKAYPKFFVADITNKKMYAYAKDKLVRTFNISAGAPATPTPTGTFKIMSKVRVEDMEGANADGSRYFQADVPWVNYFAPGGYAIHGNYWRPRSWFGNVNSSHGCIGIMVGDGEWIYNWAPVGTPVIIHS